VALKRIKHRQSKQTSSTNVDANRLATQELWEQRNLIHYVPLLPDGKVQLLLSGTSVTRKLLGAIHKHQGYPTLVLYMLERYGWIANITASVDWDGFAAAYKSSFQH
jgi:hypothetical protein